MDEYEIADRKCNSKFIRLTREYEDKNNLKPSIIEHTPEKYDHIDYHKTGWTVTNKEVYFSVELKNRDIPLEQFQNYRTHTNMVMLENIKKKAFQEDREKGYEGRYITFLNDGKAVVVNIDKVDWSECVFEPRWWCEASVLEMKQTGCSRKVQKEVWFIPIKEEMIWDYGN